MATQRRKDEGEELTDGLPTIGPGETYDDYGDIVDAQSLSPALYNLCVEAGIAEDEADADVHVYLMTPDVKGLMSEAGIWKGKPDEFDLESLAKTYGSGTYRMKIYMRLANGRKVKKLQRDLAWKLSPADEKRLRDSLAAPAQAQSTEGSLVQAVVEAIRTMQPAQPQMSPIEMMSMSLQMAQQMSGNQQQMNPIELMKFGMEMAKQNTSEGSTVKEPGSNTNDVIVAMIDKFGDVIPALLAQMQQGVAPPQQLAANPMRPQIAAQPLPQIQYPTQSGETMTEPMPDETLTNDQQGDVDMDAIAMFKLKTGINFLLDQAKKDAPTETYAGLILDNVSTADIDQILAQTDPIAFLGTVNAEVLEYREWFTELFNDVKVMMNGDVGEPGTAGA